jgi:hypothetical protein
VSFGGFALLLPKASEARRCAQFERLGLLLLGNVVWSDLDDEYQAVFLFNETTL